MSQTKVSLQKDFHNERELITLRDFFPVSSKIFQKYHVFGCAFQFRISSDGSQDCIYSNLQEEVYITQPEGFEVKFEENIVCRLKKSNYILKEASRQWFLKFDRVVTTHGSMINTYISRLVEQFHILDDILLVSTDIGLLHNIEQFCVRIFRC